MEVGLAAFEPTWTIRRDRPGCRRSMKLLCAGTPNSGRPQTAVVNRIPIDHKTRVGSIPILKNYLREYFEILRREEIYSPRQVDDFERTEMEALLMRTTYLVFTVPGTDRLAAMIRIFNASIMRAYDGPNRLFEVGGRKSFVEREYGIELPELSLGMEIHELGRLVKTAEAIGNSVR